VVGLRWLQVALTILARKATKIIFFIMIMLVVGRTLGDPESYVDHELAKKIAQLIGGDINSESLYDAYFHIDFFTVITTTTAIYIFSMKLIKKIRSK